MSIYEYPAILTYDDGVYYVRFPDIENCFTDGDTRQEAIKMACDVLPLILCDYEDRHLEMPKPSKLESITPAPNEEVVLIKTNATLYRRKHFPSRSETKARHLQTKENQSAEVSINQTVLKEFAE